MTSKQQIKDLFVAELLNTPQYQIILTIKQLILDEIARPNIQSQIIYNFDTQQTDEEIGIIKMCIKNEFGFDTNNISNNSIIIDMKQFLQ
jgi:hypothetical protein